jgi:predicted lipid-binding transport protein (Tim44 family)
MLFGRGFGGIGLLEILLIGGGIFFLMRMLGRGRAGAPRHGGRPAYAPGDPYGVGGHEPSSGGAASRAARPVYTGPDIGAKGSGRPSIPPGAGMPSGPAGGAARSDPGLEAGLRAIGASDPSFSKENLLLDARRNFTRFQEAWVARDLNPIREMVDRDIFEKCQGDLDGLRREGRINRLDDIRIRALGLVEAWQEEGFDFVTVRVEASLLDYVVAETSGEVVGGSRTEPVAFTETWTWARKSGKNPWFLSAIEQG